ncbi:MAG: hypothetical protein V3S20_00295, partial [Dehalococcoidia bacterium]
MQEAIAIYTAAARVGEAADRRRALQTVAHVHYQQGRFNEAVEALTTFLGLSPPPDDQRRALLLLGAAQLRMGST